MIFIIVKIEVLLITFSIELKDILLRYVNKITDDDIPFNIFLRLL